MGSTASDVWLRINEHWAWEFNLSNAYKHALAESQILNLNKTITMKPSPSQSRNTDSVPPGIGTEYVPVGSD